MKLSSFAVLVVTLLTFLPLSESLELSTKFFVDFLNRFNLSGAIIFYCEESKELNIQGVSKIARSEEFKFFSFFDISSRNFNSPESVLLMKHGRRPLGVLFDTDCGGASKIFDECSRISSFNASYHWLMLSESFERSISILKKQNINLDAEITLAVNMEVAGGIQLFDVYNPNSKTNGELVVHPKGTWFESQGMNITLNGSKFDKRSDLQGAIIHAGVVASVPKGQPLEQYLESEDNPINDAQHRHSYRLFKTLSEKHNFSMFLRHAPLWGILRNGSYDGVLGMIQREEIEISITPFRFTLDRVDLMRFLVVTWVTTPTIIFRHPKTGMRNIFLQPFSPWVWAVIFLVLLLVSTFIIVSTKLQAKKTRIVSPPRAFILTLGVLCQQGFAENFGKLSIRLSLFVTIVFALLIYQFYSAFIVGSLLTETPKTINSLRQLIDSRLRVGIEDITYNIDFFQTTKDKLAIELFQKKIKGEENFFGVDEGLRLVKKGGFAFHVDTSYAYRLVKEKFTEEEICELNEILLFPIRPLAVSVNIDSPFSELISVGLLRLIESGVAGYHYGHWAAAKPKCVKSLTRIKSVDIEEASVIFILLFVAILTSFIVLIVEIVYYRFSKIRSSSKN